MDHSLEELDAFLTGDDEVIILGVLDRMSFFLFDKVILGGFEIGVGFYEILAFKIE